MELNKLKYFKINLLKAMKLYEELHSTTLNSYKTPRNLRNILREVADEIESKGIDYEKPQGLRVEFIDYNIKARKELRENEIKNSTDAAIKGSIVMTNRMEGKEDTFNVTFLVSGPCVLVNFPADSEIINDQLVAFRRNKCLRITKNGETLLAMVRSGEDNYLEHKERQLDSEKLTDTYKNYSYISGKEVNKELTRKKRKER